MHILSRKQLKVITFDSLNWLWRHFGVDFLMHHRIISFTVCSGVKKKKLLHKVKEMCIVAVVAPSVDSLWGQRSSVQAGGKNQPFLLSVTLILQKHTSLRRLKWGRERTLQHNSELCDLNVCLKEVYEPGSCKITHYWCIFNIIFHSNMFPANLVQATFQQVSLEPE